jgi:hypothetical protein
MILWLLPYWGIYTVLEELQFNRLLCALFAVEVTLPLAFYLARVAINQLQPDLVRQADENAARRLVEESKQDG